jgi:hypothetical protein
MLVRTSLAYLDGKKRLKALSPVREFIRRTYPPPLAFAQPLYTNFWVLLAVWESHQQISSVDRVPKQASDVGNIRGLIIHGLEDGSVSQYLGIARGISGVEQAVASDAQGEQPTHGLNSWSY